MKKAVYILAILTNAGQIAAAFWLVAQRGGHIYGEEFFFIFLLLIVPVLNILNGNVFFDREERRLARDVRKASLRLRLKKLEEGNICVCTNGKCGCGAG